VTTNKFSSKLLLSAYSANYIKLTFAFVVKTMTVTKTVTSRLQDKDKAVLITLLIFKTSQQTHQRH